jgi:putative oxidoreductase
MSSRTMGSGMLPQPSPARRRDLRPSSGLGKIADPTGTQGYIAAAGLPAPLIAYLTAIVVELGGGILLVLGYQTRIVALALATFTLAAALGFHHDFADQNQMIHFLKNISMMGGLLQVVAFGAGAFSLDGRTGERAIATA